jgi:hypothetical protein
MAKNQDGSVVLAVLVRMNVTLSVDVKQNADGEAEVVSVRNFIGMPSAQEVMEALDGENALDLLDAEYAEKVGAA